MRPSQRLVLFLFAGAIAAAPSSAWARTAGGVTFPDSVTENGQTLVLNGIGKRVIALIIDAYASALYLPKPAHDVNAVLAETGPKLLSTRFLHAATANQVRGEYTSVYDRYCARHACSATSRQIFQKTLATVRPVKAGETASYLIEDGTLTLSVDDTTLITVHDPDYARGVLESLLGDASPTERYRNGLLGNG